MKGLDYHMDGLLDAYLNQPDEEDAKPTEDDYYEIDDYYQGEDK
jgi:hypothetical protein